MNNRLLEHDEAVTERVIIAGFGGQGVMTMGKLLVSAAMREGREVTYFPAMAPRSAAAPRTATS